ncbi:MAG TPA: LLM class flavin-dependent oxidoreductase [Acidimicrobiales bacterium]|nr:LLM class flavin-dependent oxidoreductase [Acidimicrobiales bacterium]
MRLGTGRPPTDLSVYGPWAKTAEDCGFEMIMAGDSGLLWADPFVTLTVAAHHTTSARLLVQVSNPLTRHVAASAAAAMAVQQASGGRFIHGLASGDSALRTIGRQPATVGEIRDYVTAIQRLSGGEPVWWDGHKLAMRWEASRVPVFVAAEGPKTQQMAGEVADGVILSNSLPAEVTEVALSNIKAGADKAGRRLDDIEIWWAANLVFAPTEREGWESIKFLLAGTANHVYRFHLEGKALPEEVKPRIEAMKREYDSRHHGQPVGNVNAALVDKYGLAEFLASRGTIAGPPEACAERLQELAERGVSNLLLAQFMPDKDGWMHTVADQMLPSLA